MQGSYRAYDGSTPLRLQEHPYLDAERQSRSSRTSARSSAGSTAREQVIACVRLAKRQGLDFLVLDQTRPDIEVPVVRVIVPGLRHFYRRFAPADSTMSRSSSDCATGRCRKTSSIRFTPGPDGTAGCANRNQARTARPSKLFGSAQRSRHARSAPGRENPRRVRRLFIWILGRSARTPWLACRPAHRSGPSGP